MFRISLNRKNGTAQYLLGNGDFLYKEGNKEIIRLQAPYTKEIF